MPLIDKPLSELKKYKGINPRPSDFDVFWDKALVEMRAVNPKVELVKSEFQVPFAECFDLYFTGVRKARIHAKYVRPKKSGEKHPAVLVFHGYSGNCGDWAGLLNFAGLGFSVAALDCRGQGGSSEDTGGIKGTTYHGHIIRGLDDAPDNLLFRHIFLDTAELAQVVMSFPEVDPKRMGAMGISQGGGLTLACAALEPRIKRAAPMYPFLCDYQRVWEMDLAKDAYAELRTFFRQFDPLHQREKEIFTRLGYIDNQHLAPRIRGEVLMGTGLMDTICPPSSQFAAYNKITAPKEMLLYPDYGHEGIPGYADAVFQFMAGL
ncbi:MAG: acetylxylan esterase [Lentisphaerae bacterium]|nr:acetylxylan esterase [Lentisphaerota bacterium]